MDPTQFQKKRKRSVGDLNASAEATSAPTLARVSSERDVLIDHGALDAEVDTVFGFYREAKREPKWHGLLSNITLGDKRLRSHTIPEALDLLMRQPLIGAVLEKAWEDCSYKEVRRLGVFLCALRVVFLFP